MIYLAEYRKFYHRELYPFYMPAYGLLRWSRQLNGDVVLYVPEVKI